MLYGLKKITIDSINKVFRNYPQLEQVLIYGSRAKGNYKNGSDIDLTFKGSSLNLKLLNKISIELDDLMLPYTFDLSIYKHIQNSDLIDHIERVGKVFFEQARENR